MHKCKVRLMYIFNAAKLAKKWPWTWCYINDNNAAVPHLCTKINRIGCKAYI